MSSFLKTIGRYILHATIVVCAALFLPYFGDNITHQTGLSNSFFGTIFIAATTSLPELVVAIAALKINSIDMSVGNLLGSNIFNMLILGIDDLFYTNGSLYNNISTSHLSSIFIIIIMTAVVCLGLILKPKRNFLWKLSFDTFLIVILYIVLIVDLFIYPSFYCLTQVAVAYVIGFAVIILIWGWEPEGNKDVPVEKCGCENNHNHEKPLSNDSTKTVNKL